MALDGDPAISPPVDDGSRAKNEFLSRMSHELRTPINAILGLTRIAAETEDHERKERCLEQIEKSARHLLELVNDTLDMSRLNMGEMQLSHEPFGFEELLVRILPQFFSEASAKRQHLSARLLAGLPLSSAGDAAQVGQIISHLLSNAVKFTLEGGSISLVIGQLSRVNGVSHIEISVADDGIGISPEKQEAMFLPFEQGDGSISRRYSGTGLGLSICRSLANMMGGDISVASTPGKGSRFCCELKLESGAACLDCDRDISPPGASPARPEAEAAVLRESRPARQVPDEDIPLYIDVPGALVRVRGNKTVYRALLSGFLRNTYFGQLRAEVGRGDIRAALHTLSALKGICENLALPAVRDRAAIAEVHIRGNIDAADVLDELGEAIEKTRNCADRVLDLL